MSKTILDKVNDELKELYRFDVEKKICNKCLYQGKTVVSPCGDLKTAKIMFVGESPGKNEEEQGEMWVGKSGEYLKKVIELSGINFDDCYFTNVCKCRPSGNQKPEDEVISKCKKYLMKEIEEFKGDLIVALGATALKVLVGRGSVTNSQGYGFQKLGKEILVTYHPSYVLRNIDTGIENEFIGDVLKASNFLSNDFKLDYRVVNDNQDLELMLTELIGMKDEWVSFDIETTGLDEQEEDAKVLSIAFNCQNKTWVIPLEHPDSPWIGKSDFVMRNIRDIFTSKNLKLLGQNAKFDMKWLMKHYGIFTTNLHYDTMIAHYIMEGKFITHALKSCAWKYTEYGGYGIDRDNIINNPYDELLEYNAMDVFVTKELMDIYNRDLDKLQINLIEDVISPATQAIAEMEQEGVGLDMKKLGDFVDKYVKEVTELEEKLHKYPIIKQIEEASDKIINFQSSKQLRRVLEIMKIDTGKVTKKTGNMSTDAEALERVKGKHGLISDIVVLRKKNKVLGTYLKPYVEKNKQGSIYASYSFVSSGTGRLASSNPNFQNIPYDTRQVFKSKYGCFLEADASQLELRVLAMLSMDEALMEAFKNGEDIHERTRNILFGSNSGLSDSEKKKQRVEAKSVNFGLVYGITANGLARDLKKSRRECQKWIDDYYREHPGVKLYQELVIDHVKKYHYIDTPFGRRRYFDVERASRSSGAFEAIIREAINTPIQSTASDLFIKGMNMVYGRMRHLKSKMVWEVHDSVGFDCYLDEVEEIIDICNKVYSEIKYDWMNGISLIIDMAIGEYWGKLEEI